MRETWCAVSGRAAIEATLYRSSGVVKRLTVSRLEPCQGDRVDDTEPTMAADHPVSEATPALARESAVPGDQPDQLADAHAVLAERIVARRQTRGERKPRAAPAPSAAVLAARAAIRERIEAERRAREQQLAEVEAVLAEYDRPRTRADCAGGERPCPWASCRHHLLVDVNPETGLLKLQDRELEDLPETCALDVAEKGGLNQPDTAALLGVTRQRVDQLEKRGIRLLALRVNGLR
jgi:hypothetical protein